MGKYFQKRLVIVGVEPSHLYLLKHLKQHPILDLEICVISDCFYTPYSATLPGYIATHFSFEESHVDLVPLIRWLGCQFIHASVKEINPEKKVIVLENKLEIFYDVLSVNADFVPFLNIPYSVNNTIFSKPIPIFIEEIKKMVKFLETQKFCRVAIIGGGVAGVESAFALNYRFRKELQKQVKALESFSITIFTEQETILSELTQKQRNKILKTLQRKNIQIFTNKKVEKIQTNQIIYNEIESFPIDYAIVCTSAGDHNWIQNTPLKKDERGFLLVNSYLQALDYQDIFVSGDTASILNQKKTPKTGVSAARQDSILAQNIFNYFQNQKLKNYKHQRNCLKIVSLGNASAVFCWKKLALQGSFFWWIKKKINFRFLNQYRISIEDKKKSAKIYPNIFKEFSRFHFTKHFQKLSPSHSKKKEIIPNTHSIYQTSTKEIVQSTYFLKKFIPDFYLFGKIASNHCINNFLAKQINIISITPLFFLQAMQKKIMQDHLETMFLGIKSFCQTQEIDIVGGQVFEREEQIDMLGICLQGKLAKQKKQNPYVNSDLIITKPIGAGILQQALKENQITGKHYQKLLEQLLVCNQKAMQCLTEEAIFCTALGSRGLLPSLMQHLPLHYQLKINISKIPLLDGVLNFSKKLEKNALQKDNEMIFPEVQNNQSILFSPQICGPLVIAVPKQRSKSFLDQLHKKQYTQASIIGSLKKKELDQQSFVIEK